MDFIDYFLAKIHFFSKKGFFVEDLQENTQLFLETKNSKYHIQILENKKITITGGKTNSGTRFPFETEVLVLGSSWGSCSIKPGWIGKNMHFEFVEKISNNPVRTSPVVSAYTQTEGSEKLYLFK
jgi:ABC-type phosphate transport system substrate-binding protein